MSLEINFENPFQVTKAVQNIRASYTNPKEQEAKINALKSEFKWFVLDKWKNKKHIQISQRIRDSRFALKKPFNPEYHIWTIEVLSDFLDSQKPAFSPQPIIKLVRTEEEEALCKCIKDEWSLKSNAQIRWKYNNCRYYVNDPRCSNPRKYRLIVEVLSEIRKERKKIKRVDRKHNVFHGCKVVSRLAHAK